MTPPTPAPPRTLIDPVAVNAVLIAVRQAANVLCDRWTLLLLLYGHAGVTRYADFRERCGVANRLLMARLAMLEEQEVLVRMAYQRRPLRHGYHLTHMGLALFDVLAAMLAWEQRWHGSAGGLALRHAACGGAAVEVQERCSACEGGVSPREVQLSVSQKVMRDMPQRPSAYRRSAGATAHRDASGLAAPPLPHALGIFGDKWSIEVVMCAFMRVNSFSGFQRHTGMSSNILSDRLARLAAAGVLRQDAPGDPGRPAYRLSDAGLGLFPVLVAIEAWADEWLRERARSPLRLVHSPCGQRLQLTLRCSHCGGALRRGDCEFTLPGAR